MIISGLLRTGNMKATLIENLKRWWGVKSGKRKTKRNERKTNTVLQMKDVGVE